MDIAPEEGEERILVDGVRDDPGAVPEDSSRVIPEDEEPEEGGVDEDEGEEGKPFEPGEERSPMANRLTAASARTVGRARLKTTDDGTP